MSFSSRHSYLASQQASQNTLTTPRRLPLAADLTAHQKGQGSWFEVRHDGQRVTTVELVRRPYFDFFQQGWEATAGSTPAQNPYHKHSMSGYIWLRGYKAARQWLKTHAR